MVQSLLRGLRIVMLALFALGAAATASLPAAAQEASASGEVRRVDVPGGKVTIKHGAISDLQLPAMTLVYHAEPPLLEGLKPGDKIKFSARRDNDRYVVVSITR